MNMFGFVLFSKEVIADAVAEKTGKEGRMNWQADSYYISGKDIATAKSRLLDRVESTDFENRIYEFSDEMIREIYDEAEATMLKKIATYDETHPR